MVLLIKILFNLQLFRQTSAKRILKLSNQNIVILPVFIARLLVKMTLIQLILQLRPLLVHEIQRNAFCSLAKQITNNQQYVKPIQIDIHRHYKKEQKAGSRDAGKKQRVEEPTTPSDQLSQMVDINKYNAEMKIVIDEFQQDCSKLSSLQSSPGSVETIMVKASGKTCQLQEIAKITKTPKTINIDLNAHPDRLKGTLHALAKVLGCKPNLRGNKIFIPTDKLNRTHTFVKDNQLLFVECRNKIKNIQTDFIRSVQNNTKIPPDHAMAIRDQLIAIADRYVLKANKMCNKK